MLHNDKVLPEYGPKFLVGNLVQDCANLQPKADGASKAVKSWPPVADVRPGPNQSWYSGGTTDELPQERSKASFNPESLTNVMDGGKT